MNAYSPLAMARMTDAAQGAIPGAIDTTTKVIGIVASLDATANRLLVSVQGSDPIPMTFTPNSYTAGEMVMVTRDTRAGILNFHVDGRTGGTPGGTLPTVPPAAGTTVEATALIVPEWSGTWRVDRGAYDQWNAARAEYGGRATLYQGAHPTAGSGQLYGLALYGDQIANLNAIAITAMELTLRDGGWPGSPRPGMQIRAATNVDASGAPSPTGVTMTGPTLAKGAVGTLPIDASLLNDFRTGALKALATVGVGTSKYQLVRGTSDADGMALTVHYTRAV